jgi:hypothetical protein
VFRQVNAHQRVRLYKRPIDHAFGEITFTDRDGKSKKIRYKETTDVIDFHEQIKPAIGIPANEKYTQSERDALMFTDGVLMTENLTVQNYLEASPQFEWNWDPNKDPDLIAGKIKKGRVVRCPHITQPLYTLLDETVELITDDEEFMKRVEAAKKIASVRDVKIGQELLYRLYGAAHNAPDDILKIRAQLREYLDDADDKLLDEILKEDKDVNQDEKIEILIGKAMGLGILDFEKEKDQVCRIAGNKVIKVKQIPSEYSPEERRRYFSQFLTSPDGELAKKDIEKAVKAVEKEPAEA